LRVILDTNVIIAAFATHGLCHLVFESVVAHHDLISSEGLMREVRENLKTKVKLPQARIDEIDTFIRGHSSITKDVNVPGLKCRDPGDLKVLALAINQKVEVIVTGDKDLLVLGATQGTAIVSPRQFWDMLRERK
jgi:putative PIN family toxin of toxin-antitoxin system